jgi:hypothetical protein
MRLAKTSTGIEKGQSWAKKNGKARDTGVYPARLVAVNVAAQGKSADSRVVTLRWRQTHKALIPFRHAKQTKRALKHEGKN